MDSEDSTPDRQAPVMCSNGAYACVLTPAGTGFSAFGEYQLTSWQDDASEDELGFCIYLRDLATGALTTASGPAIGATAPGRWRSDATGAELDRAHGEIESTLRLEVLADRPAERRRLRLRNTGAAPKQLEVTAYVEIVLNAPAAHSGHPGFSKLFIETSHHGADAMLRAARRPRANSERHPLLAIALAGAPLLEWDTDRVQFLGRGGRTRCPRALQSGARLGARAGAVLDPAFVLRTRVAIAPDETVELGFVLAAAETDSALAGHLAAAAGDAPAAPARVLDGTASGHATVDALVGAYAKTRPQAPARDSRASGSPAAVRAGRTVTPGALRFANGIGGFAADGREYVVNVGRAPDGALALPPMPWTNVLANERFGLVVSEKGSLSTWSRNSRLHRLTPWRNDAAADPHDEAFYLRDEDDGAFWSALPGPTPRAALYSVRHGFGYSRWQHDSGGLAHTVTVHVHATDPVRILDVRIANPGRTPRQLSFYAFNRWVLGDSPANTRDSVEVKFDATRQAVLARNPAAGAFADGIAFAALAAAGAANLEACVDRGEFLGTPGFAEAPLAVVDGTTLTAQPARDPAAALRVRLSLPPGAEVRVQALLGEATSLEALDRMLSAHRAPGGADASLGGVIADWLDILGRTTIETPDPSIDLMVNGWLVYQTLACRLWARTAFYQSGGAFGFRDQLQDAAALVHAHPEHLRRQLLANAAHQFVEGDVLHWWHPPRSEGIRTRFADDLVWLPYLTARYVGVTGDAAVLGEPIGFKRAPLLEPAEDECYVVPEDAAMSADLYTHCVRALERGMTSGAHGLPLFGCGDWNDGMNRVGREGRGESVWMAFFLYAAIAEFLPLCRLRNDAPTIERLLAYQAALGPALEAHAWDGEWYRRGYYDNGEPLGSRLSDECQIDALVQAWAVISGAAPADRARQALDALERRLVSEPEGLIRLLAPPFVATPQDPGYIKGYLAGVRENGGQYTHAALWVVKAMAEAGRRDRAAALLAMLSPVTRGGGAPAIGTYQVEPYVVAADVYGVAPHVGRGGWTWYTGSAGWMYRVALESILGFDVEAGTTLRLRPRIPDAWPGFALTHRLADGTTYRIAVDNPARHAARITSATLDGTALPCGPEGVRVPLVKDGGVHSVKLVLGAAAGAA